MSLSATNASSVKGFDFTRHMRVLCADMIGRLPELSHIDLDRVAISFVQARNAHGHGIQATLTPMRFENGALQGVRRGRHYATQRLYDGEGHELLYILSFYLPRFQNHTLKEKVATVLHELWHISPEFNGDLRRFEGRCYAHGPSEQAYDRQVEELANRWWSLTPEPSVYAFLRYSFPDLQRAFGRVVGTKVANPKLIPL